MPETAITPKSTSSLSASTSSKEESNQYLVRKGFTRCVQHKFLTYSQLPVRCQRPSRYYRPPRTSFRLTNLTKINRTPTIHTAKTYPESSLCSILHTRYTPRYKKCLSMIDLTPLTMEIESDDQRSDSVSTLEKLEENDNKNKDVANSEMGIGIGVKKWLEDTLDSNDGYSRFYQNPTKAVSLICRMLMLNAWRQRRNEVRFLHEKMEDMCQQIKHLHLQIVVLRRLVVTENGRVARLTGEVHRAKVQLEEVSKEKNTLRSEKEKMEEEMKRLNELSEERLVDTENVKNELYTARSQLRALDEQISKDREKLLKLREDKRILLEKVTASEILITERGTKAKKAESMVENLQLKLATQIALVESSQEQIQRYIKMLQEKEDEKTKLLTHLKSTEETEKTLNLRAIAMEAQLSDQETALQRMTIAYNVQLTELNELKERLIRQSQEGGWSTRMLQIAGSVVRVPRAILRTLLSGPVLAS